MSAVTQGERCGGFPWLKHVTISLVSCSNTVVVECPGVVIGRTLDDVQIDGIRQDVTESLKSAVRCSIALDPRCFRWKMLSLSGPKARVLLQLLIPLVTWSVVNVTAEVNNFSFIFLALKW